MSTEDTDSSQQNEHNLPQTQNIVSVLWPSFLVGSLTTILFFAFIDPHDLGLILGYPDLSRLGGYTIGFFIFWFLSAISSTLTCYFRRPCNRTNK